MSTDCNLQQNEHAKYAELCALASTEDLSREERELITQHAAVCPECETLLAHYQGPALENMGVLAAIADPIKEIDAAKWSPRHQKVKRRLLKNLGPDNTDTSNVTTTGALSFAKSPFSALRMVIRYAGIAAVIVLGIAVAYEFGYKRGHDNNKVIVQTSPFDQSTRQHLEALEAEQASLHQQLDVRAETIDKLTASMKEKEDQLLQIQIQKNALGENAEKLSSENHSQSATLLALTAQRDQLSRQLEESDKALKTERDQQQKATQRAIGLETEIEQITTQLREKEQTIAQQQALLAPDRDIRELMGARNLYIAEVYDVSRAGQTQKAFGRVFFTQNKSLIFYAYDLDQEVGLKNASAFQAWGKREGQDRKQAVDLGIFYVDNAANKRWALKVNDPMRLRQIDEVFVTVEPQGGSRKPSDKQLLFAYLRMDPNHP